MGGLKHGGNLARLKLVPPSLTNYTIIIINFDLYDMCMGLPCIRIIIDIHYVTYIGVFLLKSKTSNDSEELKVEMTDRLFNNAALVLFLKKHHNNICKLLS